MATTTITTTTSAAPLEASLAPSATPAAKKQLPEIKTFPNTASIDEIVAALKIAGGCIIKNAVSTEALSKIEEEIRPLLHKDAPWEGTFFPAQTRRAYGMLDVSPTYASEIVMHPTYRGVASSLLTQKNWFWEGLNKQWAVSRPQLSNTIVFSIAPGAAAQPLHRDDSIHQMVPKAVDVYPEDELRDASLGFFVAAKKATRENGATRVIPGSHLWDHEQPPDEELCTYAEMEKGDAFLMLASCFHAGSANKTTDEERLIFSTFATRGTLRQEENQYLSVSQEKMKLLPVETQKFAGYSLSEPFLGWIRSTDPRIILDPTIEGNKDMYSGTEEPAQ